MLGISAEVQRRGRKIGAIALVIAVATGLLAGAPAIAAPAASNVSFELSSTGVTYGRSVTATGSVRTAAGAIPDAAVRVVGLSAATGRWSVLAEARTSASGSYSTTFAPREQFRVKAEVVATSAVRASASASRTIVVQPGIANPMPSWGGFAVVGRDKFASGALFAQLSGRRVKLEQLANGAWSTVAQTYARADGTFELSFRPTTKGTSQIRLVVPSGQGIAAKAGPVTQLITVGSTAELADRQLECYGVASTLDPTCTNRFLDGLLLPTRNASDLFADTGGAFGADCWQSDPTATLKRCTIGSSRADATRLAFIGDSHAAGYLAALRARASAENWRIDTFIGVNCRWQDYTPGHGCEPRSKDLESRLLAGGYNAIVATGLRHPNNNTEQTDRISGEYARAWARAASAGIPVVAIGDFPYMPRDAMQCVTGAPNLQAARGCGVQRSVGTFGIDPMLAAAQQTPGARYVDMTRFYCGPEICPLVSGGVVVYRDHHHITGTFSESISRHLAYQIKIAIGR